MDLLARAVLTYLLHSTLLLGSALLACALLRQRRLALQEALLRAALVGGFVTAGLQLGLSLQPLGGTLRLPPQAALRPAAASARLAGSASEPRLADRAAFALRAAGASEVQITIITSPTIVDRALGRVQSVWSWLRRAATQHWRALLLGGWVLLASAALLRLLIAAVRLRRLLHGRRRVEDPDLLSQVAAVASRLGCGPVPVSAAARIPVPLATGVLRPEVCLPARVLVELGADEQVALCAHELAHLARRDPGWILLARLLEALAPVQPLNRLARRRLQDVAECLSDDLAVAASDRPLGLARSLVDIASWSLSERPVLPAAAAALSVRSRLGHRVERLMDPLHRLERPSRFVLPLAAIAVLATAFLSPAVSGSVAAVSDEARRPAADARPQAAASAKAAAEKPARPADVKPAAAPAEEAGEKAAAAEEARAADGPSALSDAQRRDVERRLEAISKQIEERAHGREQETKALEDQLSALTEQLQPNQAEMERLSKEMAVAAADLATQVTSGLEGAGEQPRDRELSAKDREARRAQRQAARQRMAELQKEMHAATAQLRGEQMARVREVAEQARAMAERARPTDAELAEIRSLSRQLARDARLHSRDASTAAREASLAAGEGLREAMRELRQALREMERADWGNRTAPKAKK